MLVTWRVERTTTTHLVHYDDRRAGGTIQDCPSYKPGDSGLFYLWYKCAFKGYPLPSGKTDFEFCPICKTRTARTSK